MKITTTLALLQLVVGASARSPFNHHISNRARLNIRGGDEEAPSSTGSYHGNYISPVDEVPKAAQDQAAVATPPAAVAAPVQTAPVEVAPVAAKNSKLSNFQERAPPAILMLGATYLLLRFLGQKGLIGMVLVMQWAMYSESTAVVSEYNKGKDASEGQITSFGVQKWWWFVTALMVTSGRNLLPKFTSLSMDSLNLITFGMSAVSLVGAVIQLAMISSDNADAIYRSYLGKVACCHFALLFLVGQSSFWIKTVQEYGIAWVLFPAFLVIVNDTMAYVFGVLMGKHKLLPRLSPKKTVEGFVGAGVSTCAVAVPLLKSMIAKDTPNLMRHAVILALYVSLVSPFGGFLASAVKRAHGAKDFGALIPGHGGVVDRFDCQVVTAPFVYLYLKNCLSQGSQ